MQKRLWGAVLGTRKKDKKIQKLGDKKMKEIKFYYVEITDKNGTKHRYKSKTFEGIKKNIRSHKKDFYGIRYFVPDKMKNK